MLLYMEKPGREAVQTHSSIGLRLSSILGLYHFVHCASIVCTDNLGDGDCNTYMILIIMLILASNLSNFSTDKSVSVHRVIVKLLPEH